MFDLAQTSGHMEVVGSDGQHVGTVDHVDGMRIKLTRADPTSGGEHHWVPVSMIRGIEGKKLWLTVPAAEARARGDWEAPRAAS